MPIKLNTLSLAALGLVRRLNKGGAADEQSESSSPFDFDGLVEAGEEAYDEMLTEMTNARREFEERVKSFAGKLLSDAGVATRTEIEDLRRAIEEKNKES